MPNTTAKSNVTTVELCRWALGYAFRRPGPLLVILLSVLGHTALDLLKPWPTIFLIDYVFYQKPMPSSLAWLVSHLPAASTSVQLLNWSIAATILIFLLSWAVGIGGTYATITFSQGMDYDVAADLFAKLQRLSLGFHARKPVAESIRHLKVDATAASIIVKQALVPMFWSCATLICMFVVLWRVDSGLALLSLGTVPLAVIVLRRYREPLKSRSYSYQQTEDQVCRITEEAFSAIPVVQAYGREAENDERFWAAAGKVRISALSLRKLELKFRFFIDFTVALGTAGILWFGGKNALTGQIDVGSIILFLSYLGSLYVPLQSLLATSSTILGAAGSAMRVREIMEAEAHVVVRPGLLPLRTPGGMVRLENITFGYEPGRPVLRNIQLEVNPGEMIALVGPSGAGKSTLASLIVRFADPWEGRVTIGDQDIRDVQLESLRRNIALVPQETFLFPISVAENISYGCPGATFEEIDAAARAANAGEFILKLPKGYDTVLGERGSTLSGGERQRLAIARALLKNAPILILDEPTSALDSETEWLVTEALQRLAKGRTTFIIAHRLSTIRLSDRIVVLQNGEIKEAGRHEDLLNRRGVYARVHELQFGRGAG